MLELGFHPASAEATDMPMGKSGPFTFTGKNDRCVIAETFAGFERKRPRVFHRFGQITRSAVKAKSARLLLNFSPILFGVFKHLVDLGFSDFQNLEKNRNECCEPGSC